jgi:hypothetical protein
MDKALVAIIATTVQDHPCIHSWIPVWAFASHVPLQNYVCRYCEMQVDQQVMDAMKAKESRS